MTDDAEAYWSFCEHSCRLAAATPDKDAREQLLRLADEFTAAADEAAVY